MQGFLHQDPGPCLICGVAQCACGGPPTEVVQLPARDAAAAVASPGPALAPLVAPVSGPDPGDAAPLGDGSDDRPFSTATYRGLKKRGSSSRP